MKRKKIVAEFKSFMLSYIVDNPTEVVIKPKYMEDAVNSYSEFMKKSGKKIFRYIVNGKSGLHTVSIKKRKGKKDVYSCSCKLFQDKTLGRGACHHIIPIYLSVSKWGYDKEEVKMVDDDKTNLYNFFSLDDIGSNTQTGYKELVRILGESTVHRLLDKIKTKRFTVK